MCEQPDCPTPPSPSPVRKSAGAGLPPLVDSHVHLDRYPEDVVRTMLAEAEAAGVQRLLTIAMDLESSRAALRLAARHPSLLAAVGVHPAHLHTQGRLPLPIDLLSRLIREGTPAAIGEVGLDADAPDQAGQQQFLAHCVALAADHDLPLVLHVVGEPAVHRTALDILAHQPHVRAVAHYFVGGPDLARWYLEAGCWISVGRPVTRLSEEAVRAAMHMIPLNRLLLETDTYPLPGRTTSPKDVRTVCAAVAELTGQSFQEIAAATTANFAAFLGGTGASRA